MTSSARDIASQPSRTEPSTQNSPSVRDETYPESYQSAETVRHVPGSNYGTIQPAPQQPSRQDIASPDRYEPTSLTSSYASLPPRSPLPPGVERPPKVHRKRSGISRRTPSANTRHRNEYFSTEDDISEVKAARHFRRLTRSHSRNPLDSEYTDDMAAMTPEEEELLARGEEFRGNDGVEEDDDDHEEDSEGNLSTRDSHDGDDDDDGDSSDAESFTLKDRQQAINKTHPFGIRLWKPALYKKSRSVQETAEGDIHSSPGGHVSRWLILFNLSWTLVFGWWLAALCAVGAFVCFALTISSSRRYGEVLWGLAGYLFYPFGKLVRLEKDEAYLDEDQDEGRSISEYEQWQNGDIEYGRLFFGPDAPRSIVGRSRRSMDSVPSETDSLLAGRRVHQDSDDASSEQTRRMKRRLFGRGKWDLGRIVFFLSFYLLISPALFFVSMICWFFVFSIPMGKVTLLLLDQLRRHPLALSFDSGIDHVRDQDAPSSVLVCTYRAVGTKYWKYTIDGTNIFLINLMAIVVFVVGDWLVLDSILGVENFWTSPAFLFTAGLLSIIPLAYFIGQAVASISAQSSMGVGAAINAFFATVVEVYLYCVALNQGKRPLVEGSIVGSIFAGILFLPGLSMCFGAIKRKTQRFNAKSAGVTSTMLLFAVIGAFSPTLFYQIYGTHELNCTDCIGQEDRDCRRCYFTQVPSLQDRFYLDAVRPYCYLAATALFLAYAVGLWFTLRTHAAVIWNMEGDEKKHEEAPLQSVSTEGPRPQGPSSAVPAGAVGTVGSSAGTTTSFEATTGADIRESHLYKRILGQSLKQIGLAPRTTEEAASRQNVPSTANTTGNIARSPSTPHLVPPKPASGLATPASETLSQQPARFHVALPGLSEEENNSFVREVAEVAATAATIAARNVTMARRPVVPSLSSHAGSSLRHHRPPPPPQTPAEGTDGLPGNSAAALAAAAAGATTANPAGGAHEVSEGGHDAPNWSRLKSTVILLGATVLYAIIAEILVDNVDVVLQGFALDEKFLGITLFALVPNTTEFLNAISFAMNGNIALSMEIGSAYALQVCMLQIPALVLYSALATQPMLPDPVDLGDYVFSLLFPQWDMVCVILCVFLLSYMYGEGKSNYFKGSILVLSYVVVVVGYYFSSYSSDVTSGGRPQHHGVMNLAGGGGMGMGMSRFDRMDPSTGQYVDYKNFQNL